MMAKPVLFLKAAISGVSVAASTTVNGSAGIPYQWNATLSITAQQHSDNTSVPLGNFYTGMNVAVNDWIVSGADGGCLRIASISAQTSGSVTCVLEDTNNINALSDNTGNLNGMIQNGAGIVAYIFAVVGNVPLLSGVPVALPGNLSPSFVSNIISRFESNYGGSSVIGSDTLLLGVQGNTNKRFQANTSATLKPELRYNTATSAWEYTIDGVSFTSIATPSFAAITGKPNSLAGYGITDAVLVAGGALGTPASGNLAGCSGSFQQSDQQAYHSSRVRNH